MDYWAREAGGSAAEAQNFMEASEKNASGGATMHGTERPNNVGATELGAKGSKEEHSDGGANDRTTWSTESKLVQETMEEAEESHGKKNVQETEGNGDGG